MTGAQVTAPTFGAAILSEAAAFHLEPEEIFELVAVHEAGHAVIALATGLQLESVGVHGKRNALGEFDITHYDHQSRAAAVTFASGARAAEYHLKLWGLWTESRAALCEESAAYDRERIRELPWPGSAPSAEKIAKKADKLLARHWHHVTTVAAALIERGHLTGKQVSKITGL